MNNLKHISVEIPKRRLTIAAHCQQMINETHGGTSVIVIEHHLAVMAHAGWIIELGPGADLVAGRSTLTGQHLAAYVGRRPERP
ncbi:MAG: hypothetical protein NVSMB13_20660 [Mycobacteriales bacterium]